MDTNWLILVAYGDAQGVPPPEWSQRQITNAEAAEQIRKAYSRKRLVHLVKMDQTNGSSGLRRRIIEELEVELPTGVWGMIPRFTATEVKYIGLSTLSIADVSVIEVRGNETTLECFQYEKRCKQATQ